MNGLMKGFLTGAAFGTLFALATSDKTGRERQQDLKDWVDGTTADVKAVTNASDRLQKSATHLQETLHTHLEPAMADINKSVEHYQFRIAPHLTEIQKSLGRIEAAVPEQVKDDAEATPETDQD